ncbi:phosphate-selective porin OprO/OprP [Lysobacter niabensis]|uniref:Phosphate-selective porin OprO/OprP n=1 Tax=Agrilutibacter niabensis TaxID=380628 RepID=A0ABU1VQ03_9GAMM|nr:OprO/OprP family phosphate-selective porin [Lysobacter niabensis]MDR7099193.1 phosphate-selective porin OprO/OprP [Lysobacter niabensis]
MKLSRSTLSVALLAALFAPAAHAEIALDVIGGSEISFEGLVQAEGNWYDNDLVDLNSAGTGGTAASAGANGKDTEFGIRRAEIILKGKGPGNFEWTLGYDPSAQKSVAVVNESNNGATNVTSTVNSGGKWLDVNAKYKIGGNANHYVQVGQYKQPNSLEELSSTRFNDFISKAAVTNTYAVARRTGVAYSYGDVNWSVTGAYFGRELTRNLGQGQGFGLRGTWAPINETGNILHVGLAYVDYDTDADTFRLRSRPDADLATQRLVDSGDIRDTDRVGIGSAEGLWVHGPFKVQGEYYQANLKRYGAGHDDYKSDGGYISGVWNVTGETWGYKAGVPVTNLPEDPGAGMWQVGLRYDTLDLNDGSGNPTTGAVAGVLGGKQNIWTAGVNWYWRSNFKFALNYVMVDTTKWSTVARGEVDDNPNIVEGRIQFYW